MFLDSAPICVVANVSIEWHEQVEREDSAWPTYSSNPRDASSGGADGSPWC